MASGLWTHKGEKMVDAENLANTEKPGGFKGVLNKSTVR